MSEPRRLNPRTSQHLSRQLRRTSATEMHAVRHVQPRHLVRVMQQPIPVPRAPRLKDHPKSTLQRQYSNETTLPDRSMASSDKKSVPTPASTGGDGGPPGQPTTMSSTMLDKGAAALQSLRPVKQIKQHVCTFALYAHDPHRQVETHHFVARLNQDVLQCPVYDSDDKHARLIGVEYIVSRKIFEALPAEEQRLWHSHAHEIKAGLWASPRVPEMLEKTELDHMAGTFGKFWCTWQVDRGDRLPLGAPELMVSPQPEHIAIVRPDIVRKRDKKYGFSTEELKAARADVEVPTDPRPGQADYWVRHHKGFAVDVVPHEMKRHAPFP